jgi:hypothetical protein
MKISVIWNFGKAKEIFPNWRDGHRAAIEEIAKKYSVNWFLEDEYKDIRDKDSDFLLFWTDANDDIVKYFDKFEARKGVIITSDNGLPGNIAKYDVVYCESKPVLEKIKSYGVKAILGMGTDTDFYHPREREKDIEYFYPATFSPWKRQSEIAYLGNKLTCIGTVQPDGWNEHRACIENGVNVEVGYFPAETIRDYYERSKKVIIPAVHGSERTVLEAMSMNVWPEVVNSHINVRTASYVEEYVGAKKKDKSLTPRDFIVKNYSHKVYAKALLKGIENG